MATAQAPDPLAKLREPFPPHQISKLPKETGTQAKQRKADQDAGKWPPKCAICEGYHHPKAVHLDYVGHAALTDRLLDVDPHWTWEPVAFGQDGLPVLDREGGLWIKLTVCGVTRLGYGHADGKQGGNAIKEAIGDALRNAAMRFGAALDLWHKGDLHLEEGETSESNEPDRRPPPKVEPQRARAPEPRQAAPAAKPVDRSAETIPTPTSEDVGDWEAWRKVLAKKIVQAGSAVDIGQIVRAHESAIDACDTLLPDTKAKIDGLVEERKVKLAGEDFRGEGSGRVAGRDGQLAA